MITASIPARSLTAFALLLLISGVAAAQVQQVYRYIDVDGRVVYSDKPPPPGAKDAQAKRIGGNSIETSDMSFATAQAQERYPVTLYTFACGNLRLRAGFDQQTRGAAYGDRHGATVPNG